MTSISCHSWLQVLQSLRDQYVNMWNLSFVSLLLSIVRYMMIPLKSHSDCCFGWATSRHYNAVTLCFSNDSHLKVQFWSHCEPCIVMSHQVKSEWSHMMTFRWPRIYCKVTIALLCEKLFHFLSLKTHHKTAIRWFYIEVSKRRSHEICIVASL